MDIDVAATATAADDDGGGDDIGLSLGSPSAFFCQTSMMSSIGLVIPLL